MLDSLTNETSVYLSIREAARARGGVVIVVSILHLNAFLRVSLPFFFISDIRSLKEQ